MSSQPRVDTVNHGGSRSTDYPKLSADAQIRLDLAAVDRRARPGGFGRVHLVEWALCRRHVVGGLEELDRDRGALVRVVENLDSLGGNVDGRSLAGLGLGQSLGEVIGID